MKQILLVSARSGCGRPQIRKIAAATCVDPIEEEEAAGKSREYPEKGIAGGMGMPIYGDEHLNTKEQAEEHGYCPKPCNFASQSMRRRLFFLRSKSYSLRFGLLDDVFQQGRLPRACEWRAWVTRRLSAN
jgi:hypothetical protein